MRTIYISCQPCDITSYIRKMYEDLNKILQWSIDNSLFIKISRNALFTLKRLWATVSFKPIGTRCNLVTALIIPQFSYHDKYFSKTSAELRERIKMTLNSCARNIYGILLVQFISIFNNKILDAPQFGRSKHFFNIIAPAYHTAARASSFLVQGEFPGTVCRQKSEEKVALARLFVTYTSFCE
jgi:hypothetical protein